MIAKKIPGIESFHTVPETPDSAHNAKRSFSFSLLLFLYDNDKEDINMEEFYEVTVHDESKNRFFFSEVIIVDTGRQKEGGLPSDRSCNSV